MPQYTYSSTDGTITNLLQFTNVRSGNTVYRYDGPNGTVNLSTTNYGNSALWTVVLPTQQDIVRTGTPGNYTYYRFVGTPQSVDLTSNY